VLTAEALARAATAVSVTPGLTFDAKLHRYYLKDKRVPSVSEVLEPLLELDGIPRDVLEAARITGQHVHHAVHLMVNKQLEWGTLDPALVNYVAAARLFLAENDVKVLASEYRMADEGLRVAGTLDLLGIIKRYTAVFDWKVTATMPRTAGPQTAAYDHLYRKNLGGRPMRRYAVQLFDDGTYELFPQEDPRDMTWFTSCLNIWHWRNSA
jgi:hypothetical protein